MLIASMLTTGPAIFAVFIRIHLLMGFPLPPLLLAVYRPTTKQQCCGHGASGSVPECGQLRNWDRNFEFGFLLNFITITVFVQIGKLIISSDYHQSPSAVHSSNPVLLNQRIGGILKKSTI